MIRLWPAAGAILYLEDALDSDSGTQLQTNALISDDSLSSTYGLACYSPVTNSNTIGEWRFPNGDIVGENTNDQEQVLFIHRQLGRVTLQIREGRQFTSALEGVYTCTIPDETGAVRTLYAGVYTAASYASSGKQM